MTKKDYTAIADVLAQRKRVLDIAGKDTPDATARLAELNSVAYQLSHMMAQDNPRFNRERFLTACGL